MTTRSFNSYDECSYYLTEIEQLAESYCENFQSFIDYATEYVDMKWLVSAIKIYRNQEEGEYDLITRQMEVFLSYAGISEYSWILFDNLEKHGREYSTDKMRQQVLLELWKDEDTYTLACKQFAHEQKYPGDLNND